MTVVQIPMGGRMVGIDIPPLDVNDIDQLLAYTINQNNILTSIAGAMGTQTQAINQLSGRLPNGSGGGQGGGGNGNNNIDNKAVGKINNGISTVANALTSGGTKLSSTVNDLLSGLNLGALGAGVGTYFGILEEYGSSMQQLNRVGAGLGQNFIELRNDAATLGLGLSDISKLSKESGVTIGALGKNSADGVNRLMKFTAELRKSTEAAGYYGMGSAELAQYMADELEIRRQQGDSTALRTLNETALAKAMNENLAAQQAMAAITGQDVYDRIKAQQEARKDAQVQAFMTADQQAAYSTLNGELSAIGATAQGLFGQGLKYASQGLQAPKELQDLFQAAGQAGVPLREEFDKIAYAMNNNLPTQDLVTNLGNMLKNSDFGLSQSRIGLAGTGSFAEGTNTLATIRSEAIGTGTNGVAEAKAQRERSQAELSNATASGEMSFLGTTANLEEAMAKTKAVMSEAVLIAAGIDVENLQKAQQGFSDITKTLRDMPDTEPFKDMMKSLAYVMIVGSGTRAVVNPGSGKSPAERDYNAVIDANNFLLQGLKAMGINNKLTSTMEAARMADYGKEALNGMLNTPAVQKSIQSSVELLKTQFAGAGDAAATFGEGVATALKYMALLVPGMPVLMSGSN